MSGCGPSIAPALIAYITAGDPSPDRTPELVAALERGGADLIELGVPFSDPIADGPVIQRGSERALKAGTTVSKVLGYRRRDPQAFRDSAAPVYLYESGAALWFGCARARCCGARNRRLPAHRSERRRSRALYRPPCGTPDSIPYFLAAPTSTERRMNLVAEYSTGFIYLVSRTGVTGERDVSFRCRRAAG